MCGLCGYFTQNGTVLNKNQRLQRGRVAEALLIANQTRGTDSTGVASIKADGHYNILKEAKNAGSFILRDDVAGVLRDDSPLLIGHTRMASMGSVTDNNAHPFLEGNIIGAHNGIINNWLEIDHTVSVDSQAVLRELNGEYDNFSQVFADVSGSCNLTWWDARDATALYLISHLNPLSAAIVENINTLFWSSEHEHLESVMWAVYGPNAKFITIKADTVYRIDHSDIWSWQEEKVSFRGAKAYTYPDAFGRTKTGYYDDDDAWAYGYAHGGPPAPKAVRQENNPNLPVVIKDEADRYDEYWQRVLTVQSGSQRGNVASNDDDEDESNDDGKVVFTRPDFDIETCGYCMDPLDNDGIYMDDLEMMLCPSCVAWMDKYGEEFDIMHAYSAPVS